MVYVLNEYAFSSNDQFCSVVLLITMPKHRSLSYPFIPNCVSSLQIHVKALFECINKLSKNNLFRVKIFLYD